MHFYVSAEMSHTFCDVAHNVNKVLPTGNIGQSLLVVICITETLAGDK